MNLYFWIGYALIGLSVGGVVARTTKHAPDMIFGDYALVTFVCLLISVLWPIVVTLTVIGCLWFPRFRDILREEWHGKKIHEIRDEKETKRQVAQLKKQIAKERAA